MMNRKRWENPSESSGTKSARARERTADDIFNAAERKSFDLQRKVANLLSHGSDPAEIFREIEIRLLAIETEKMVNAEQSKHLDNTLRHLEERLNKIEGHIGKLVWLIITAIISTLLTFLMRGTIFNA